MPRGPPAAGTVIPWGLVSKLYNARRSIAQTASILTMTNFRAETRAAPVAELVDATDLKSVGRKAMPVRFRPGAPTR